MITHKQLEILVSVARLPGGYRRIRKDEIVSDYTSYLCDTARSVLLDLLGEPATDERAIRIVKTIRAMAKRDLESLY